MLENKQELNHIKNILIVTIASANKSSEEFSLTKSSTMLAYHIADAGNPNISQTEKQSRDYLKTVLFFIISHQLVIKLTEFKAIDSSGTPLNFDIIADQLVKRISLEVGAIFYGMVMKLVKLIHFVLFLKICRHFLKSIIFAIPRKLLLISVESWKEK